MNRSPNRTLPWRSRSSSNPRARKRLVSAFDWETTIPEQALGYRFDIVLRGRDETPTDPAPGD